MASSSFPLLVFSCEEREQYSSDRPSLGEEEAFCFCNVIDRTSQVKQLPGLGNGGHELRMSTTEDGGWVLLRDKDSEDLFLYNLTSFQRIPVPTFDDDIDDFTFTLPHPPSHPNSSLVAVNNTDPYWLQCHPGADQDQKFTRHALHDWELFPRRTTGAYQGKVYADGSGEYNWHVIDPVSATTQLYKMSYSASASLPSACFKSDQELVVAGDDLFLVRWNVFYVTDVLHSVDVFKLDLPNRDWMKVDGIGDWIFFMGKNSCSVILGATAGSIKGNRIYFMELLAENMIRPYSYDLDNGCLIHYMLWRESKLPDTFPHWIILPEDDNNKKISTNKSLTHLYGVPSIKTPYLFFAHKKDGSYKMVDPFSKACYSLECPQLAGALLYSSQDGWLVVYKSNDDGELFLYNIFTQSKIQLPRFPPETNDLVNGLALSSPPTSSDCMLFGIADPHNVETTEIYFYKLGDHEWTKQVFFNADYDSFSPAHNCAVFHKGLFHSLGSDEAVGVYDHNKQKWTVLSTSFEEGELNFDVGGCYMLEWNGKLLSALMEKYSDCPRKVFQLRDQMNGWENTTDLRDGLLFVGRYGSILAPAPDNESKNSICLPKFKVEGEYQPVIINPSNLNSDDNGYFNSIEYTINTCWVMRPRGAFQAS